MDIGIWMLEGQACSIRGFHSALRQFADNDESERRWQQEEHTGNPQHHQPKLPLGAI